MNEPNKNRVTVYEVERFCERLHKLVIEAHPSLGEPSFSLDTGTLRVSFPQYQIWQMGSDMGPIPVEVVAPDPDPENSLEDLALAAAQASNMSNAQAMQAEADLPKPRKSKKVPQ